MSIFMINSHGQEEIIRHTWHPTQAVESEDCEISSWEILNPNSKNPEDDSRHWFKQNYTNQNRISDSAITYH